MDNELYLEYMFAKIASISFQSKLESLGSGNLIDGDNHLEKLSYSFRDAYKDTKEGIGIIGRDLIYGGTKDDMIKNVGVFSKGSLKAMRNVAAPGAILGGITGAGIAKYYGGSNETAAKAGAGGAVLGGLGSSFITGKVSPLKNTMSRNMGRLMAGGLISEGYSALARERKPEEGFFESAGRRTGDVAQTIGFAGGTGGLASAAQTLGLYQVGGTIAGGIASAKGYDTVGKVLSSVPSFGDIGGTAGKGLDLLATGTRKILGGGKSYSKTKSQALGPSLNQPKPQALDGQQYNFKPEYK